MQVPSNDARLKSNNFDFLRFLFAFIVFMVHAQVLSQATQLLVLGEFLSSEVAVKSFFVISGFLIFMSYENTQSIKSFVLKRIKRIYPAYFFVILTCVGLGAIVSAYTLSDYFSIKLLKYIASNLVFLNFLQPTLPGVFEGNSLRAVNGALWTLKIEILFYLFVPLAVLSFRKFGRLPMLVIFYLCSIAYSMIMEALALKTGADIYLEFQRQLPGQISFFIVGAACYYYFDYLVENVIWLLILAFLAFCFQSWLPWVIIQPIALGVLVVFVACVIPCFGDFDKYGDFSYGIYIVHFPILQLIVSYGLFEKSPWVALLATGVLVMTVAFLLWHFIEKPFLRRSSHYVAMSVE